MMRNGTKQQMARVTQAVLKMKKFDLAELQPLPASRLAVLPATSHTAISTQTELLFAFIEPFLKGETPKGIFEKQSTLFLSEGN